MSEQSGAFCVVEDNDSIRRLIVLLIEKGSYPVVSFADGESAIEWLVENKPEVILCDIMLPGMSGVDVLQCVRDMPHGKDIKVMALTAFARSGDREKYLELGFNGYMSKPINPQSFLSEVCAMLGL